MLTDRRTFPFLSLGGLFEKDDAEAASNVIGCATELAGNFFPLPEEKLFEEALAVSEGATRAVAVNSCGTALDLCMHALGIAPGDEVIVPPLTFVCTATCAAALGATIIFADIDSATLTLTPESAAARLTPRTKAIIPVHFAGLPCDLNGFDNLSRRTGVPVIYDAAHAVGARYLGDAIGGAGRASCYSFQSNKNITTLGEGGAVTTSDQEFGETIRRKKTFGFIYGAEPRVVTIGFNYRLTKPQLAVGITQLAKLPRIISRRLERFERMRDLLADIDEVVPPAGIGSGHACHLFVLRVDSLRISFSREALRSELQREYGIQTVIHYPAVWSWEVFDQITHDRRDCPVAEKACREVFSVPLFPTTPFEDLDYIGEALKASIWRLKRKGS